MSSSLAVQLAQNASLNSALLTDRARKRTTDSYLFAQKDADVYDFESILSLATNALLQLSSLNPDFGVYENTLFSRASRNTDRTLLSKDANKQLDKAIGTFLAMLSPYIMDAPAGKVLEWLVRRYRYGSLCSRHFQLFDHLQNPRIQYRPSAFCFPTLPRSTSLHQNALNTANQVSKYFLIVSGRLNI